MLEPRKDYFAPMHTAEHILNQTMVSMFGCQRSFSNHIERKKSKCDYHFERNLEPSEIEQIELNVNQIIDQHLEITSTIVDWSEAKQQFNLDKLPDMEQQKIRIVNVGHYDSCPCIGEHVNNTSEIGRFKITTVSFENNVLRLRYKLGN
jgi:misacylated tRNA(Ala) deacylase